MDGDLIKLWMANTIGFILQEFSCHISYFDGAFRKLLLGSTHPYFRLIPSCIKQANQRHIREFPAGLAVCILGLDIGSSLLIVSLHVLALE